MVDKGFFPEITTRGLGDGSGVALWGFRACAAGRVECCRLVAGFEDLFGAYRGGLALRNLLRLAQGLGRDGTRRVQLALPGSLNVTFDEVSVLASLSAAQCGDLALRDAHLSRLLGHAPCTDISGAADAVSEAFSFRGLVLEVPRPQGAATVH